MGNATTEPNHRKSAYNMAVGKWTDEHQLLLEAMAIIQEAKIL